MIEHVIYTEEADDDVVAHYHWYESREPGLGEDFLRCVEACVLGIQRHPRLYPVVVDDFRRALVRRFPIRDFLRTHRGFNSRLFRLSLVARSAEMASTTETSNR